MEQSKFYQIKNVTEHEYTLVGCDGNINTRSIQEVDKSASAFTIEDAKDGDVLASGDFIFIYNNKCNLQAYCYYSMERNRFIIEDMGHICHWNMQEVTPATKEQRDTLKKAMADAGYKWNKEELKLEKI